MARSGRVIQGKEYMAPCTGLQLMPGTVFRISSVNLAFSAKALRMAVRSYTRQRKRTDKRKKTGILANTVKWIIHTANWERNPGFLAETWETVYSS